MSLIEQAAKRLAELERAGVAVPWSAARVSRDATLGAAPLPARASEAVHAGAARAVGVAAPALPAASPTLVAASIIEVAAPAPLQTITRRAPGVEVNLDLERLHQAGYLVPDQVRSSLAEQFRHLKRPLLKNAAVMAGDPKQRGALIMVTSALPGEGKTFCAINLAVSLAMEVDTAVILVDADVVRPSVFSRLGLDTRPPGLMDLLTRDDLQLQDALVATNIPKLSLLASGDPHRRSTELLASASMDRLLTELATEWTDHLVIFDAPPLLLTTESSVLASRVGQVLVVVEAHKTRQQAVRQAFAALQGCPLVLAVLNKSEDSGDHRHYGYYY